MYDFKLNLWKELAKGEPAGHATIKSNTAYMAKSIDLVCMAKIQGLHINQLQTTPAEHSDQ